MHQSFRDISFAQQTLQYIVVGQARYPSVPRTNKRQKHSTTDLNVLGLLIKKSPYIHQQFEGQGLSQRNI